MSTPEAPRSCALPSCDVELPADSKRIYCERRHKELDRQRRRRAEQQLAIAAAAAPFLESDRTASCKICGIEIAVHPGAGRPPEYCADHHPKQPCQDCGKLLRHGAKRPRCRSCSKGPARPAPARRHWTKLCGYCRRPFKGRPRKFCSRDCYRASVRRASTTKKES